VYEGRKGSMRDCTLLPAMWRSEHSCPHDMTSPKPVQALCNPSI